MPGFARAAIWPAYRPMSFPIRRETTQSDRSPGGRAPLCAHSASHAVSHRRISMPFNVRVPTTECISAVNCAPVSLSVPNDRRLPMTGALAAARRDCCRAGPGADRRRRSAPRDRFIGRTPALRTRNPPQVFDMLRNRCSTSPEYGRFTGALYKASGKTRGGLTQRPWRYGPPQAVRQTEKGHLATPARYPRSPGTGNEPSTGQSSDDPLLHQTARSSRPPIPARISVLRTH